MPASFQTKLTLPVDARAMPLAHDFVRGLALVAGLPEDQAEALALAVREACQNSLEYTSEGEEGGTLELLGEVKTAALTLSLYDRGLPFYQAVEPEKAGSGPACPNTAGLYCRELTCLNQCFDAVEWFYRGVEGNELRLTKNLAGICHLPATEPESHGLRLDSVKAGDSTKYTIRLLRPGDGIHLARLIYRVYGYSYSNEDFYYPDRLDHALAAGKHVGVVAVTGDGEIVGHTGVERERLGPLAELGQLAVAPAHRGQGLRKLMGDLLQEEITKLGLLGLFGEAVTIHTISQEASESRGLYPAGIKLLDWQAHFKTLEQGRPPSSQWETEAEPGIQRESMVFYFKYLVPPSLKAICVPSRHREMLLKIYRNLGVAVHYLEPSGPTGPGKIKVYYDQATGVGGIRVDRIGLDILPEIYQARRDLCDMVGAKVVGLYLPLSQGGTSYLCEAAEGDGFFFSGVQPLFAGQEDFLRLQYLNAELDPARIHLYSPFAKELLAYVLEEKKRVV